MLNCVVYVLKKILLWQAEKKNKQIYKVFVLNELIIDLSICNEKCFHLDRETREFLVLFSQLWVCIYIDAVYKLVIDDTTYVYTPCATFPRLLWFLPFIYLQLGGAVCCSSDMRFPEEAFKSSPIRFFMYHGDWGSRETNLFYVALLVTSYRR